MKRILGLILISLPFLLAGCASVGFPFASDQDTKPKEFLVDPNNASVYIYRVETISSSIPVDLDVNGKSIGKSVDKSYFQLTLPPGDYVFGSHAVNADGSSVANPASLSLTLEAGKIYYVKQGVGLSLFFSSIYMEQVDEVTGRQGVDNANLIAKSDQPKISSNAVAGKSGFVFGSAGVIVEKLAMKRNCQPVVGASLQNKNGPVEDYTVKCSDGSELGAHCEYLQCLIK